MNPKFDFTPSLKKWLYIMMGTGLLGLVLAFIVYSENSHSRFWTNLLANTYYFTGIGLFGLFAVSAATIAYGGWHTLVKRILLSLSAFTVYGGFILLAILVLGFAGVHNLYEHVEHILHTGAGNPKYTTKLVYFAPAFWIGRVAIYALLWAGSSIVLNRFFGRTDQTNPAVYKRAKLLSAAFIVIFGLTESAVSWDMIMSLDPHWYSTLFGWYNFASYGCAAWGMTILLVIFLKSQGYLERVNENHIHDLGKLLFGFSIFWTYLWFDQFMLQWYANVPEEVHFWYHRFNVPYFKFTIFFALIVNFLFPLFFLIKRGAKRNFKMIGFGSALLILGHYVDFFNFTFVEANWNGHAKHELKKADDAKLQNSMVASQTVYLYAQADGKHGQTDATVETHNKETEAPENAGGHTVESTQATGAHGETPDAGHGHEDKTNANIHGSHAEHAHGEDAHGAHGGHGGEHVANFAGIGILEIMIFIGFLGAFLYLFFNNLSKRPIVPEDDPYLKENEKLEVIYS